jgi:hypothetical protein
MLPRQRRLARSRVGVILILCIITATLGIGVYHFLTEGKEPTPDELLQEALGAPSPVEQEKAAAELSRAGPEAAEQLVRVMNEGQTPEARAAAIYGLGATKHWKAMPQLLNALEDPPPPRPPPAARGLPPR